MKEPALALLVPLLAALLTPANVLADGMFVAPKFVWDKHKDISEPTQKAILVYDAGREDLILQVKYEGPVSEFGWLVPVPNLPTVQKGSMKCFYELSHYTQKHFETEWQHSQTKSATLGMTGNDAAGEAEPPVKVIEIKTVGAYEIAVLATKDTSALEKWLDANHFSFPTNATGVIDSYVKRQWYFIAAKVNLEQGALGLISSALKLPAGELNPLQISFAGEHCVYPLKISSANGTPSEIQVYVLSPEPLLEKTMLEKKLPMIYSNDLAQAQRGAQSFERFRLTERNRNMRFMGGTPSANSPLSAEEEKAIQKRSETPIAGPDELLPYAKVTKTDLPDSSKWIPRLAEKTWWLTKQTWTFKPEEMRDLEFEPALTAFMEELGSRYGYFAAASLTPFGSDAVPVIIAAMQSTNPTVRENASGNFNNGFWGYGSFGYGPIRDSRLTQAALNWLKDSEPSVRYAGVQMLTDYSNWNPKNAEPLVGMLRDDDASVRHAAMFGLPRFRGDLGKYVPAFEEMLKDKNPGIQLSGLQMLQRLQVEIPRQDLLPFFKSSDWEVLDAAYALLRDRQEKLSDDDALILLQNPQAVAQLLGLSILSQNPEKQSVELALPLLRAPDELVRLKAAQTLRALTGKHFTEDQTDEWVKWWMENKTNFVVHLHPEELRPRLPNAPLPGAGERPPPRSRQENPN
jgi:HEAT repeat protein